MGRGQIERKVDGMWLINGESERRRKKIKKKKKKYSPCIKRRICCLGIYDFT